MTADHSLHPASRGKQSIFYELVSLAVSTAVFLLLATRFFRHGFIDDTYIGMHYVRHLLDGHGLTWNIGEPPVEGFTSLLWLLLLGGIGMIDPAQLETFARTLNIALGAGGLILCWYILRRILPQERKTWSTLAGWHLALSPIYLRHSISGMDTLLCCLLFLAVFVCVIHLEANPQQARHWVGLSLLTFLSTLVRPDGFLFGAVCAFGCLCVEYRNGRKIVRPMLLWVLPLAALMGAYLTWKLCYFHSLLPLPFYIKQSFGQVFSSVSMLNFWLGHLTGFVSFISLFLLIVCMAFCLRTRLPASLQIVLAAAAAYAAYFCTVLPVMSIHFRYFMPIVPILVTAAASCLAQMAPAPTPGSSRFFGRFAVAMTLLVFVFSEIGSFSQIKNEADGTYTAYANFRRLGEALHELPALTIAHSEAGNLPYFSDQKFIDLVGLNDAFIARNIKRADFGERYEQYLLDRGLPDLYFVAGATDQKIQLDHFPALAEKYLLETVCQLPVYVLKDSPARAQIEAVFARLETR